MSYDIDQGLVLFRMVRDNREFFMVGIQFSENSTNGKKNFFIYPPVSRNNLGGQLMGLVENYQTGSLHYPPGSNGPQYGDDAGKSYRRVMSVFQKVDQAPILDISGVDSPKLIKQGMLAYLRQPEVRGRIKEATIEKEHIEKGISKAVEHFFFNKSANGSIESSISFYLDHTCNPVQNEIWNLYTSTISAHGKEIAEIREKYTGLNHKDFPLFYEFAQNGRLNSVEDILILRYEFVIANFSFRFPMRDLLMEMIPLGEQGAKAINEFLFGAGNMVHLKRRFPYQLAPFYDFTFVEDWENYEYLKKTVDPAFTNPLIQAFSLFADVFFQDNESKEREYFIKSLESWKNHIYILSCALSGRDVPAHYFANPFKAGTKEHLDRAKEIRNIKEQIKIASELYQQNQKFIKRKTNFENALKNLVI